MKNYSLILLTIACLSLSTCPTPAAAKPCIPLPSRCEKDWILSAAAVVAVGGGCIAGYGAGGHQTIVQKTKIREKFQFPISNEQKTLEWILPPNDPQGPLIRAEIFRPDATLYFAATLGRTQIPPNPPPIGSEGPAQVGQYRAVFTVILEGNGPISLGGLLFNGTPFETPTVQQNILLRATQEILVIDYPSGIEQPDTKQPDTQKQDSSIQGKES